MADGTTTNHLFVLPEIGASKDSWGTKLNANFTKVDQLLKVGTGTFVARAGDSMTGMLTLPATLPTANQHATNKLYVDNQITAARGYTDTQMNTRVPNTRTLTGGDGITTAIGDLSANRTISVDATVARRNVGNEFNGAVASATGSVISKGPSTTHFWMQESTGEARAVIFKGANSDALVLRSYAADGLSYKEAGINGTSGQFTAPSFAGVGSLLTNLDASAIDRGTLADTRIPTNIVRNTRTLTGGDGITTVIGDLSANRTISVDATVVRTTRNLVGGDGINAIGNLGADRTISVDASVVRTSRILTGGDGINTIGDLSANRTISVDSTVVRTSRTVTGGNGMVGGGGLSANVVLSLGTPGTITNATGNTVSATSHTHSLDLGGLPFRNGAASDSLPRLLYIDGNDGTTLSRIGPGELHAAFSVTPSGRFVGAGAGLTGGGDFTANRSIAMGTPSNITATSGNTVSATSHTHALSADAVRELLADSLAGQIGTYAFLKNKDVGRAPNQTHAGSLLRYSDTTGLEGNSPSGSWRAMGNVTANGCSLFVRYA